MNKKKIIAEIAARHGVLIREDDPAFYIVDLATMAIDQKIEEIRKSIEEGEQSIPQALDLKRKEIEKTASKLLAASESLEANRKRLTEKLKQDVDAELRARVDNYINQILSATKEMIELTVRSEIIQAAPAINKAARELDQARQAMKRNYIKDILWMILGGVISGAVALLIYVRLFQ